MSNDVQEQVWLCEDTTLTFMLTQEVIDDTDVFAAIDRDALQKAELDFMRAHPDMIVRQVQIRKSKHVTHDFDPYTLAPYDKPRHYYIVYIRVHYTPIDNP